MKATMVLALAWLGLTGGVLNAAELKGCHFIAPAMGSGPEFASQSYFIGGALGIEIDPYTKLTGQTRTAPIYIRRIKVYIWGGATAATTPPGGWASVQINRSPLAYAGAIGVVAAFIGQGRSAMDELDLGEHCLKLDVGETLLIEGACAPGQPGIQPVVDVYWTDAP